MASAELKEQRVVTREVVLTLTEEEAQFLFFLLGCIGGDPVRSKRRHASHIHAALRPMLGDEEPYRGWRAQLRAALDPTSGMYFVDDADVAA